MRLVVAFAFVFALAGGALAGDGKVKWEKDYKKALKLSKAEKKPMLLYFGGPG